MKLSQLKQLVADAEKWAQQKGKTIDEYPVYVIDGPNVREIRTYSPADHNRGGVAFILEGAADRLGPTFDENRIAQLRAAGLSEESAVAMAADDEWSGR